MKLFFTQHPIGRVLRLALREWPLMLLSSALAFATVGSSIGLAMTSGVLIAKAALHSSVADLGVAIVGVRFFGIARGLFRYFERLISHATALRLLEHFRAWFFSHLRPLVPMATQDLSKGDLLGALARDIDDQEFLYARVIGPPLVVLWVAILLLALLGWHGILYALWVVATLASSVSISLFSYKKVQSLMDLWHFHRQKLESLAIEINQGAAELRVLGLDKDWRQQALDSDLQLRSTAQQLQNLLGTLDAWVGLFSGLAALGVLSLGLYDMAHHGLSPVALISMILGTLAAAESVQSFPQLVHSLAQSRSATTNLFAISDRPIPVLEPIISAQVPTTPSTLQVQSLQYQWNDPLRQKSGIPPLIHNLSFTLSPGESLALIGPSGIGKTTLAHLLVRFLEPTAGRILWGDRSISEYSGESLRQQILLVDQFPHLFTGTIADNLRIVDPLLSEQKMCGALERIGLELPLDTWVGIRGSSLSGGQRQRISAARALILLDSQHAPNLLILDEPAAHLDGNSELEVLQAFLQHPNQPSLLVITHRHSNLSLFSRIIALDNRTHKQYIA